MTGRCTQEGTVVVAVGKVSADARDKRYEVRLDDPLKGRSNKIVRRQAVGRAARAVSYGPPMQLLPGATKNGTSR